MNMICPTHLATAVRRCGVLAAALVALALAPAGIGADESTSAASPGDTAAAILPITKQITNVTVESLKRRIEQAREQGAGIIIFELDTPGGLVTSSIAVADLIKNMPDIKTVAWVNPNAHSGGTIIAVACDEIVMARSSRMGDSQVIMFGPGGAGAVPKELQPKAYTPVLAEFRASCRLNGYDQRLCEAFVLPDREVWWLENIKTGQREFVFRAEKEERLGEPPKRTSKADASEDADAAEDSDTAGKADASKDTDIAKDSDTAVEPAVGTAAATGEPEWRLAKTYYDPLLEMDTDVLQPIVPDTQLLEMSAGEAQAYGFSKAIIADEAGLRERFSLSSIVRIVPTWSEALAFWLTSMYVRGFLLVIIMLGAYVEFHTPGVGVPGLVALICLAIFVGAPYLTGLANIWEILFLVIGFLLIALEIFVIPGFGVAGISGIVLVILALVATFVPDEPGRSFPFYLPSLPGTVYYLKTALLTVVLAMATSLIGMVMMSRYLPRLPLFSRLVPANPTPSEVQTEDVYRGLAHVGDVGEAAGPLRPAGKVHFGSILVDVVTQGEYLEPHTRVEIIERRGNRVVVRAVS